MGQTLGGRSGNRLLGAVYLLVGVLGLFILDSAANTLSLNGADVLPFLSAAVLLGIGLTADKRVAARG